MENSKGYRTALSSMKFIKKWKSYQQWTGKPLNKIDVSGGFHVCFPPCGQNDRRKMRKKPFNFRILRRYENNENEMQEVHGRTRWEPLESASHARLAPQIFNFFPIEIFTELKSHRCRFFHLNKIEMTVSSCVPGTRRTAARRCSSLWNCWKIDR